MTRLIECVPNFSEGRDIIIINKIAESVSKVSGIKVLDIYTGADTNRTVITFAGTPDDVTEAAFRGIKTASELIDMSKHKGKHPRIGATDVCPLIPLKGISMEETVEYAHKLAKRAGEELNIPVYCYEYAAFSGERRNLENIRAGEYEGLRNKMSSPGGKPDFGPNEWSDRVEKTGAVIIGARNYLIAFNINLNTDSVKIAKDIAADIRESGRIDYNSGKTGNSIQKVTEGVEARIPGSLKKVKALGWYIKEFGCTQISMNITDMNVTPVHLAFEEVVRQAEKRGVRVTGSELVGLIPLKAMLDAGRYFRNKMNLKESNNEDQIIKSAVKYLGLDTLHPFNPFDKIIEYKIQTD